MTCPAPEELNQFARGELPAARREAIVEHISTCRTCAAVLLPLVLASAKRSATPLSNPAFSASMLGETFTPHPKKKDAAADAHDDGTLDTQVSGEHGRPGGPSIEKGRNLDRYVVLERLGAGGMGEVYAAWDPVLDRKVAVKLLRPDFQEGPRSEEFRLRLVREAQSLARLSHPNVVTVHDVGLAKGLVYLAMEFVEGQSLTTWLRAQTRSWQEVLEVFLEAGEGLAAAHASGITHRDFKPDNVLVGTDGRVRVMDFGLAHAKDETPEEATNPSGDPFQRVGITQPGTVMGTPAYMSPEALFGRPSDARSDEFGYCVALYEALYGYRPFDGNNPVNLATAIQGNEVKPPPRDTQVPRRIHVLLLKGLRADPRERFQTLRALLVQLGRRRTEQKKRLLLAGAAAAVALVTGLGVGLLRKEQARCEQVSRRLDGVWDAATRAQGQTAFLATKAPWAPGAWDEVQRRLDEYAQGWVAQRRAACEANDERPDSVLGEHLVCLSRRLADLQAVSQLFAHADADVVERAVATAGALPALDACTATLPTRRNSGPEREEVRAGLAAVKARIDAQKFKEALERATELVDLTTRLGARAALAEARIFLAVARARLGDLKGADQVVEDAILLASTVQEDELVARGWVERLGIAALGGGKGEDAERWGRYARATVERQGNPPELEASLANNLGVLAWSRGNFEEAIRQHQRTLELRTRLLGSNHPLVARAHANLGADYKGAGRADDAVTAYRTALAIEEKVLGPMHPAVAETLNNLSNALRMKVDNVGALAALQRALVIKEAAQGKETLSVAITLTNLGGLLADIGKATEAEGALTRALAIKEKVAGADSLTVASTLTNLASLKRSMADWSEAMMLDQRAYDIRRKRLGPAHVDLAYNLNGIGASMVELGKPESARPTLEAALALRTQPGLERAETSVWLARCLLGKHGDPRRARALLQQAVADIPESHPLRLTAQHELDRLK